MAALQDWENIVSAHINGAPLPAMMDAVRDAAIRFCRDTRIVRSSVTVNVEVGRPDSEIPDSPDGLFPVVPITVYSTERKLDPVDYLELETRYPKGYANEEATEVRQLTGWISRRPGTVFLVPTLTIASTLSVDVAFQPKRNAFEVPQFLYELYANEIGWGAIASLHAHSMAPYAQPDRVGGFQAMFMDAIKKYAYRSEHGFGKSRLFDRKRERP